MQSVTSIKFSRNGKAKEPAEVVKRDGSKEKFDKQKIALAVERCCLDPEVNENETIAKKLGNAVAGAVTNILQQDHEIPNIEYIQRLVIQQLWALDAFAAAEHYHNYREAHKKARSQRPISPELLEAVATDQKHFPTDLQYYQLISKFSRWREQDQRRETWKEVCERVMGWFKRLPMVRGKLKSEEWTELNNAIYNLEASPAMRVVQMAGPALERCHVGVYNCSYAPIDDLFSFPEMLYILMQGTGYGFSVENDYINELPRIKKQKNKKADTLVVDDSTEGWCDAYYRGLQAWFDGHDVTFDVSHLRPTGARLKTKGGRSSGPGPFLELMSFARNTILAKQGRYLDDIDGHSLACMTGKIVQVGGVRRASLISLSDLTSLSMRSAKSGNWYDFNRHFTMANNSAVYDFDGRPPIEVFMDEWLALVKSKSGERGIFNRAAALAQKPKRRKMAKFGTNPCAEILLRMREFCNLSIAIARPNDTIESLKRKVRIATIFGLMQSTCTNFGYIRDDWKKNCEEERLLGVDINGHADCPLLRFDTPDRDKLLRELKQVVTDTKIGFAARFGINLSAADTCIKPSGDSAAFFGCASGVSPYFSEYQMRWVRESMHSPVAQFLKETGVPYAVAPEDPSLYVFGFPKKAPEGATMREDMTAIEQLENWLEWKENWAEHSVSATIYVDDHEWLEVGAWVYEHFDHITGLSFLPRDNGRYSYAPNEACTKEQYEEILAKFPALNWAKLTQYELEDMTEAAQAYACVSGVCSLS